MNKSLKKIIPSIALATTLFTTSVYANTNDPSIRVWSFNMEGWAHQRDMQNDYYHFLHDNQIADDKNTPDFIATQENYSNNIHGPYMDLIPALKTEKPSTDFAQYGRARGGPNNPAETNAIIYNSTRWELIPQAAQIQNELHATFSNCDVYNKNNTGLNSLTCQLQMGHDNYARIVTWGIFRERLNAGHIVIITSTHNALNTPQDQTTQQKQVADVVNKLVAEVKLFYPGITPTVVAAGDYNTGNLDNMRNNMLDKLIGKDGKPVAWDLYLASPDGILSNASYTNSINYFNKGGSTVTDHGPIAETVTLDPNALQPR